MPVDTDGGHLVIGIVGGGVMPAQNAFNRAIDW